MKAGRAVASSSTRARMSITSIRCVSHQTERIFFRQMICVWTCGTWRTRQLCITFWTWSLRASTISMKSYLIASFTQQCPLSSFTPLLRDFYIYAISGKLHHSKLIHLWNTMLVQARRRTHLVKWLIHFPLVNFWNYILITS